MLPEGANDGFIIRHLFTVYGICISIYLYGGELFDLVDKIFAI